MNYLRCQYCRHFMSLLALLLMVLTTACERQSNTLPVTIKPGEVRTFTGTWTATGTRQIMQLEPGHDVSTFRLSGSLLLKGEQRLKKGFKADIIGFSDSLNGMEGRCVWTDERGDKVFSNLYSDTTEPGALIKGKFIGGTGPYIKVGGEYTFKWRRLVSNENGEISGRTVDLKGWARLGGSDKPSTTGGQQ